MIEMITVGVFSRLEKATDFSHTQPKRHRRPASSPSSSSLIMVVGSAVDSTEGGWTDWSGVNVARSNVLSSFEHSDSLTSLDNLTCVSYLRNKWIDGGRESRIRMRLNL